MSNLGKNSKSSKRAQFALLVLLFLLPPLAAYILFYSDFKPASAVNYGNLITPARPMKDVTLVTPGGQNLKLSELRDKWTLLYLGGQRCDAQCSENLYSINQVRLAQGKNIDRVISVFIAPEGVSQTVLDEVATEYPGILILLARTKAFADLSKQMDDAKDTALQGPGHIYIVDPLGNLMMSYQVGADPSGIRKDLKRLLKLSQVG